MQAPTSQSYEIETQLNQDDWNAFLKAVGNRVTSNARWKSRLWLALWACVGAALVVSWQHFETLGWVLLGLGVGAVITQIWFAHMNTRFVPSEDGSFFSPGTLHLSAAGLKSSGRGQESSTDWSWVKNVSSTETHVFLWMDQTIAQVIPVRELPDGVAMSDFMASLESWVSAGKGESATVETQAGLEHSQSGWSVPPRQPELPQGKVAKGEPAAEPTGWALAGVATLAVVAWLGVDWWAAGGTEVEFSFYGVPGIVWNLVPIVVTAWVIAVLASPPVAFSRVLFWVLAGTPVLIILSSLSGRYFSYQLGQILVLLAGMAMLLIVSVLATGRVRWMGVAIALAANVGIGWLDKQTYIDASVWYPVAQNDDEYREEWNQAEELLFSQAQRIDRIVDGMQPSDKAAGYFVGFAGEAEEKVFAEEIKFAAEVMADRYGSGERTLLLLNDARYPESAPIASTSGLEYGLKQIAKQMDVERDVLFLALSSHGSVGSLSVSNGYLPLRQLKAESLNDYLDDAGIKWRVLLVSSCYSGSFIDALANPNTAIIAAAAPDRTSFGCSNERDLTFFGEAFYRDSVPYAENLRSAYEQAKKLVTEKELAAGYEPSNPLAFFGEEIEAKLLTVVR